ncbi:laccase domain-containing protein, partial [Ruminococcaceae bacterium OttesenSCG-928-A11]|nr:laccase domain-containing protein [Ruminococcaceae bacterium OttesenSCG-928-A11]
DKEILQNREKFLKQASIDLNNTALIAVDYSTDNFSKYFYMNSSGKFTINNDVNNIPSSDGLTTMSPHLGIFLPLADCLGVVLYDDIQKILMVVHAGRHNLKENGLIKAVEFMKKYGAKCTQIKAWLSPSAGEDNYPLYDFDNKSLEKVAREQLNSVGVNNIISADIDTTKDNNYYSHSQGDSDKRHAILAYIVPLDDNE